MPPNGMNRRWLVTPCHTCEQGCLASGRPMKHRRDFVTPIPRIHRYGGCAHLVGEAGASSVEYQRGGQTSVTGFTIGTGQCRNVRFVRVELKAG